MANFIVEHLNEQLGVEGPHDAAPGLGKLLLSFKDPDDKDTTAAPTVPPDIWHRITTIFLEEFIF